MTTIHFVEAGGSTHTSEAADGASVMQTAVSQGIPGIVGECGGSLMCSTCHVYVDEDFVGVVGPVSPDEDEMLDAAAAERRPTSRLSCQLKVSPAMAGLVVHTPESQY